MKKVLILLCIGIVFIVSMTGCQSTKTRAAEGAAIGGLLGAAAGGIIGHQSHHGGEGAAIGAAAGAITGALIGSQIQKSAPTSEQATSIPAQPISPNQMSLQQIVELSQQGVNDDVIVDKIRLSGSRFTLSDSDITYLKQQGVSQKVIDAMRAQ